jgi:hypothetical protein
MKSELNLATIQDSDELKGVLSVKLKRSQSLDKFCVKHFNNYDPRQYEAVAIRVFYKKEVVVTLYAIDRIRHERTNFSLEELPVKKFKSKGFRIEEVLEVIEDLNFTLSTGNYAIDSMRVVNK